MVPSLVVPSIGGKFSVSKVLLNKTCQNFVTVQYRGKYRDIWNELTTMCLCIRLFWQFKIYAISKIIIRTEHEG